MTGQGILLNLTDLSGIVNASTYKLLLPGLILLLSASLAGQAGTGIQSNGTGGGAWDQDSSWNPASTPEITDTVIILQNDTIFLTKDEAVHTLVIEPGGVLICNNSLLAISGDSQIEGKLLNNAHFLINGTTSQTISSADTISTLSVDKPSGDLYLSGNLVVSGVLRLIRGEIVNPSDTIIVGTGTGDGESGSVVRSGGHLTGTIKRYIHDDSTGTAILFPVGSSFSYRPALVTFNSPSAGSLITSFNPSQPGNTGFPLNDNDNIEISYSRLIPGEWYFISELMPV
jgi:hypothetical protein